MYHTILTDPNAVTLDYVAYHGIQPFHILFNGSASSRGIHNYNLAAPNVATATSALKM